jgi:CHASE2 domain-containing sensor protein
MNEHGKKDNQLLRVRSLLWIIGGAVAVLGVVLALISQSWIPLVCIALGLGVPLLPLSQRRR